MYKSHAILLLCLLNILGTFAIISPYLCVYLVAMLVILFLIRLEVCEEERERRSNVHELVDCTNTFKKLSAIEYGDKMDRGLIVCTINNKTYGVNYTPWARGKKCIYSDDYPKIKDGTDFVDNFSSWLRIRGIYVSSFTADEGAPVQKVPYKIEGSFFPISLC